MAATSSEPVGLASMEEPPASTFELVRAKIGMKWQVVKDKSKPWLKTRWVSLVVFLMLYYLRVHTLQGWYIITYGLAIYLLNLFIGFLSPPVDSTTDAPLLPLDSADPDEFRPFMRKVDEFTFWYKATVATTLAFLATFFSLFDIPVFWPILLIYFIALFAMTMRRQIKHMFEHGYVPWSRGKKSYGKGKKGAK